MSLPHWHLVFFWHVCNPVRSGSDPRSQGTFLGRKGAPLLPYFLHHPLLIERCRWGDFERHLGKRFRTWLEMLDGEQERRSQPRSILSTQPWPKHVGDNHSSFSERGSKSVIIQLSFSVTPFVGQRKSTDLCGAALLSLTFYHQCCFHVST